MLYQMNAFGAFFNFPTYYIRGAESVSAFFCVNSESAVNTVVLKLPCYILRWNFMDNPTI